MNIVRLNEMISLEYKMEYEHKTGILYFFQNVKKSNKLNNAVCIRCRHETFCDHVWTKFKRVLKVETIKK